ncbi:MAG: LpxI family protein [Proteobacteria bacterium]|nr:LpxI family protein [Pseudomonadota bacterium]
MENKITNKKLGIIAGGGDLPAKVIDKCRELNKPFFVITFKDQAVPSNFETVDKRQTQAFGLGSVGSVIKELKQQNVEEIIFAGNIEKPSLFNLDLDLTGIKILAKVAIHHDDQILRAIAAELEKHGFNLLGAHNLCEDLLIGNEILSGEKIATKKGNDILLGVKTAHEIGKLDIGQAVVVKDNVILGVEAVEGTDELLKRCATLRGKEDKGGILVKMSKPQQHLDLDMPSIGINTIKQLVKYNYDGIVVSANSTIVLNKAESVKLARKNNILLAGVDLHDCEN